MRYYHFLNAEFGLKDLHERRIKIARITELNDPFEFLGVDIEDRMFREALMKTKVSFSHKRGLLCFSKNWQNPVMWSHYADKHKGICLGFEIPDGEHLLLKVKYVQTRLPKPFAPDEDFMKLLLSTKFTHWEYEEEYRAFLSLEEEEGGLYFANFSDDLSLREVIIGVQSTVTRQQILDAIGDSCEKVDIFKAKADHSSFLVVRDDEDATL